MCDQPCPLQVLFQNSKHLCAIYLNLYPEKEKKEIIKAEISPLHALKRVKLLHCDLGFGKVLKGSRMGYGGVCPQ